MWYEKLVENLSSPQTINDSKTPSGRIHVGSLRGVLIHDAVFRTLKECGMSVQYKYGIDDYDPLDGLPSDAQPLLKAYMGFPLCNIPPPAGSGATDLAEHYIAEFLEVFKELGVSADIYRMRDIYRSGTFDEAMDRILRKADTVRKIYAEVSNSSRPDNWHPLQVICENCGRIGTTEVTAYDGKEVAYTCRKDLVSWATGCGYSGNLSPFGGNGKLPWKLEWAAKWHVFGVTLEGAGKDHCTKGGSRDVAGRCLAKIFGDKPPLNIPYEFFLVSGAKMSSSKGIGTSAREMANFLPPEVLRFLIIRTPPKKTVNFSTDFDYMVKLFNEYDRLIESSLASQVTDSQLKMLRMVEVTPDAVAYHSVGFQLLTALLQLPHINVEEELEKKFKGGFSQKEKQVITCRINAAKYWLDNYASEKDRVVLRETLPESISNLSESQKAFLHILGDRFPAEELDEEGYQKFIFDVARLTPVEQKPAFSAIYRALLDKDEGPKGGALFAYLDKAFLRQRFLGVQFSRDALWNETAITIAESQQWFSRNQRELHEIRVVKIINALIPTADSPDYMTYMRGKGVIELYVTLKDMRTYLVRILFSDFEGEGVDLNDEAACLDECGKVFLERLAQNYAVGIMDDEAVRVLTEPTKERIRLLLST